MSADFYIIIALIVFGIVALCVSYTLTRIAESLERLEYQMERIAHMQEMNK